MMSYERETRKNAELDLTSDLRYRQRLKNLEKKFGISELKEEKIGYLYNVKQSAVDLKSNDGNSFITRSCVNLFFVTDEMETWRATLLYKPYFFVLITNMNYSDMIQAILYKKLENFNVVITLEEKYDLKDEDHLVKRKRQKNPRGFLKISFYTVQALKQARDIIRAIVKENKAKEALEKESERYCGARKLNRIDGLTFSVMEREAQEEAVETVEAIKLIEEIFESDVLYVSRVCIDNEIRCGFWYKVSKLSGDPNSSIVLSRLSRSDSAPLSVLAWDIECSKEELKFPDSEKDEIILISYMYNAQGYLIVNREVISSDISSFCFKPNEQFQGAGSFQIFNEKNEKDLLKRFFQHIVRLKPHILATYNGDNFDFKFVHRRAQIRGLNMEEEIGIIKRGEEDYAGEFMLNMDCYKWVERDSYLPNGSRSLKAVCRQKLLYNPVEIDPEDMILYAKNDPQKLAIYSVSDAVATFYLYETYVHTFILALSTIVPMNPEDVLRQGSGTLCEQLLMAEAYDKKIIFPNKHEQKYMQFWTNPETLKQHLIFDDSYVGGQVESLRCGIYRDDLEEDFSLSSESYQTLIDSLDTTIDFWLCKEAKLNITKNNLLNYEEVKREIMEKLIYLRNNNEISLCPKIYHLDVGAMYPNIILTHRLQPPSIVSDLTCSKCSWKHESAVCQRIMKWRRKLEISPADRGHILPIWHDLHSRIYKRRNFAGRNEIRFDIKNSNNLSDSDDGNKNEVCERSDENKVNTKKGGNVLIEDKTWIELTERQKHEELVRATKEFSLKAYKKTKISKEVEEESIVCQRENPFYVNTVRAFRNKRYEYKKKLKEAEEKRKIILQEKNISFVRLKEIEDEILLHDSLQLAHKCILNSFYGYVKRNGSRWFSQEMGAIVTHTGSQIIKTAKDLIDGIGISIELDTDGIWCMLPNIFPDVFKFSLKETIGGKNEITFEYLCSILNLEVHKHWSNHQYLQLIDEEQEIYEQVTKNEVFFELDGPWKGMFLPASEKVDELLKKRYVVFDHKGRISELKGFEIKRRGELQIIKSFQSEIFLQFLKGETKQHAYEAAAAVAYRWKNLIESKGKAVLDDDELFNLIGAKKVLNKSVKEQVLTKSMAMTTAKRLSEFLENKSYVEDTTVTAHYIVASKPVGIEPTARAIPIQIFKADNQTKIKYLRKWLKDSSLQLDFDLRDIIDWTYYQQRLEAQLQKLICIPAVKQGIRNPISSINLPDWLQKQLSFINPKQKKITSFFKKNNSSENRLSLENSYSCTNADKKVYSKEKVITDIEELFKDEEQNKKGKKINLVKAYECDSNLNINSNNNEILKNQIEMHNEAHQPESKIIKSAKDFTDFELRKMFQNNFDDWLIIQRQTWKVIRSDLKRRKALLPNLETLNRKSKITNLETISSENLFLLLNDTWQLFDFQIDENNSGIFHCRITTSKSSRFITADVNMKRKICINFNGEWNRRENENIKVKKCQCNYILPRGVKQLNLLELEMDEEIFQKHKASLCANFHQKVAGIYETKIPLYFDFISRYGNLLEVHTTHADKAIDDQGRFISSNLTASFDRLENNLYLQNMKVLQIHIFHSSSDTENDNDVLNRLFIGIYAPDSVIGNSLLYSGIKEKPIDVFDPAKLWKEICEQNDFIKKNNSESIPEGYKQPYDFMSRYGMFRPPFFNKENNLKNIFRQVELYLREYQEMYQQEDEKCKTAIFLYSTLPFSIIEKLMHIDHTSILFCPEFDLSYTKILRQNYSYDCLSLSIDLLYSKDKQIEERLALSRLSHIPLGVIIHMDDSRCFKFIYDVLFAQMLRKYRAVLWANDDAECDLGHPSLLATSHSDFDISGALNLIEKCNAGIYRTYCVKFLLDNSLIFNGVRLCHLIHPEHTCVEEWERKQNIINYNLTKSYDLQNEDETDPCGDEPNKNALSVIVNEDIHAYAGFSHTSEFDPFAFRVLGEVLEKIRMSMERLQNQVTYKAFQNVLRIISFFYNWACDSSSLLFDPALRYKVQTYGEIYFLELIRELEEKHSLKVVYGSLRKIVVATNSYSALNGRTLMLNVFKKLNNKNSLFHAIPFTIFEEYKALLQLDNTNYMGYKEYTDPDEESTVDNLKILEFLPPAVEVFIRSQIDKVIILPLREVIEQYYTEIENLDENFEEPDLLKDIKNEEIEDKLKKKLKNKWFTKGAFFQRIVYYLTNPESLEKKFYQFEDENQRYNSDDSDGYDNKHHKSNAFVFPNKIGNLMRIRNNWKFEAAKLIVKIMQLDFALELNLEGWKLAFDEKSHELFELCGTSEYGSESSNFKNSYRRILLRDIECSNCNRLRDIDIVTDVCEVEHFIDGVPFPVRFWKCEECGEKYDFEIIEFRLMANIEDLMYAYLSQDFICTECKSIKIFYRNDKCKCGHPYVTRLNSDIFKNYYEGVLEVSKMTGLQSLKESLEQINNIYSNS